ncbi:MAG TPA: hypothetical protein VKA21_16305 [Candidatus Binatia bacterium]|nr:hypothetical protein [Candidatus Binatia bacterium]
MHPNETTRTYEAGLQAFVRTHYFYGQLLDVHHFEQEQSYFNQKRWLLNRLVLGYGVVCGLDVQPGEDGKSVVVLPGVAIDRAGREIVVPTRAQPVPLPPSPGQETTGSAEPAPCDDGAWAHVCLCFHECESDPAPVLVGECGEVEHCVPGAVRERYRVIVREGKAKPAECPCCGSDVVSGGRINHQALAIRVTRRCRPVPADPCILLANVRLPRGQASVSPNDINITVRPVVYTNHLLYELVSGMTNATEDGNGGTY